MESLFSNGDSQGQCYGADFQAASGNARITPQSAQVLVPSALIQLSANSSRKAAGNSPSDWAPADQIGKPIGVPDSWFFA